MSKDLGKAQLRWNLGYTQITTTGEEDIVSVYLSSHARHLVMTQLYVDMEKFNVALTGLYKNRNEIVGTGLASSLGEDYMVWNTKFRFPVFRGIRGYLELGNIFDVQYFNILGAQMPRRWVMGGINMNF